MNDYMEMAAYLLGVDAEDQFAIEEALAERWDISFEAVAAALLPLTPPVPSPLSGQPQHVFWRPDGDHYSALAGCRCGARYYDSEHRTPGEGHAAVTERRKRGWVG